MKRSSVNRATSTIRQRPPTHIRAYRPAPVPNRHQTVPRRQLSSDERLQKNDGPVASDKRQTTHRDPHLIYSPPPTIGTRPRKHFGNLLTAKSRSPALDIRCWVTPVDFIRSIPTCRWRDRSCRSSPPLSGGGILYGTTAFFFFFFFFFRELLHIRGID